MRSKTNSQIYNYINHLFAEESQAQLKTREGILRSEEKPIQIEAFEGKILSLLIKATGGKKVLEFGTMHGYSTSWLADSVGDDGLVVTIEKDPHRAKVAAQNLQTYSNVEILNMDAGSAGLELAKFAPFDFVFIDANKSAYQQYFEISDNLLRVGGMIVADNCIFEDMFNETQSKLVNSIKEFNKFVARQSNYQSVILPTAGGLLCCRKEFIM